MSSIGVPGIILLVLIALLLFGPNKLPELGRAFGRTLREFKSGAREIMDHDDAKDKGRVEVSAAPDIEKSNKRLPD